MKNTCCVTNKVILESSVLFFVAFLIFPFCVQGYKKTSACSFGYLNFNGYSSIVPDDDYYSSSWHLSKIEAEKAWEITTGLNSVSVGIIDSGINSVCPDLSNNIDYILSKDCFSDLRNDPIHDSFGHGTAIATLVGAEGNNNQDFAGLCWDTNLVSLRNDDYYGQSNGDAVVSALYYAENNSIPIVNLSSIFATASNYFGLPIIQSSTANLMNFYCSSYSGLFVVCAGNQGEDLDDYLANPPIYNFTLYPQTLSYSNIIVVGASNENDARVISSIDNTTWSSNYGQNVVDLFAPGKGMSTYPFDNDTGTIPYPFGGTSAAAPLVAGTAALMKSVNPNLTTSQLKSLIIGNVDSCTDLTDCCVSGGRLNTYKAVKAAIPEVTTFNSFVNGIQPLPAGKHQFYKLSLVPGTYTFETNGNLDTSGFLYGDIQSSPIANSINQSGNFSFTFSTIKNRTVYLKVINTSSSTGTYGLKVSTSHLHSYNQYYVQYDGYNHKAYCSCGQHQLKPHIADPNNICVMCGGLYTGPMSFPLSEPVLVGNDSHILPDGTIVLGSTDYNLYLLGELDLDSMAGGATT